MNNQIARFAFGAVGAGDVHAETATVKIEHRSAGDGAVAEDVVLEHPGETTAAAGKIPAHHVIAIGHLGKQFALGHQPHVHHMLLTRPAVGELHRGTRLAVLEHL